MAKLLLLLVFVCFQFSSQEELSKVENGIINEETTVKGTELLDGTDVNELNNEKNDKLDEEWTAEDEKWLQEIEQLLKESDEDYGDESALNDEFDKLMEELDKYFDDDEDDDDDDDDEDDDDDDWGTDKNHLDLFYSWLYQIKIRNADKRTQPFKRFTSV